MPIIKGKADKVVQRDGQKGPYWFVTINGQEYYCGDKVIADKEGKFVTMESYTTKSGKNALKSLNGQGTTTSPETTQASAEAAGKKDWVPRYRDTKEADTLDKAFSCRTMCLRYAIDHIGKFIDRGYYGDEDNDAVKNSVIDVLKVYMALHDTVALGTDIKRSEEVLLMTKVDARPGVEVESGGKTPETTPPVEEKKDNRPALKRVLIETAAQVGVVPLKAMKKYIGKSVKSLDDLTEADLMQYIEILTKEKEAAEEDVPF